MPRKPSGRLPADRTPERSEGPNVHSGLSTEGLYVPPMSEDLIWDMRMVATFVHLHPERFGPTYAELGPIADVFFALGLADPPGTSEEHPAVPKDFACPTCDVPKGRNCTTGDGREMRFHVARIRLAANAITEKESPMSEPDDREAFGVLVDHELNEESA